MSELNQGCVWSLNISIQNSIDTGIQDTVFFFLSRHWKINYRKDDLVGNIKMATRADEWCIQYLSVYWLIFAAATI